MKISQGLMRINIHGKHVDILKTVRLGPSLGRNIALDLPCAVIGQRMRACRFIFPGATNACIRVSIRISSPLISSPLYKMAAILADDNFKCIFLNKNDVIPIQIALQIITRSSIDNKSALVQVMAWCRTGGKPLSELMLTQFNDAYMRH